MKAPLRSVAAAAFWAAFFVSGEADAQTVAMLLQVPCAPATEMDAALASYQEKRFALATDAKGQVTELRVNPDTGSFSLLITKPGGLVCLVAAGKHFTAIGSVPVIPGQPI